MTTAEPAPSALVLEVDGFLLDLDGTLVDSTASVERSWRVWAQEYGVDEARLVGHHGRTARAIVTDLLGESGAAEATARIAEIELADCDGVVALPGAVELLDRLPEQRWTVVTSGSAAIASARLRAAGLPSPPTLVTADDVRTGKPDPEPYLLGASRLGLDPRRCVVLEDALSGVLAARAAGSMVVGVGATDPGTPLPVDLAVDDPAGLLVTGDGPFRVATREPGCRSGSADLRR